MSRRKHITLTGSSLQYSQWCFKALWYWPEGNFVINPEQPPLVVQAFPCLCTETLYISSPGLILIEAAFGVLVEVPWWAKLSSGKRTLFHPSDMFWAISFSRMIVIPNHISENQWDLLGGERVKDQGLNTSIIVLQPFWCNTTCKWTWRVKNIWMDGQDLAWLYRNMSLPTKDNK